MNFEIKHVTKHYIRIRLSCKELSDKEAFWLKHTLPESNLNITKVTVHQKPASLMIEHDGNQDDILSYLKSLELEVPKSAIIEYEKAFDSKKELYKQMSPALKRELRKEILMEAAVDIFLPAPVGIACHIFQLANLEANA